MLSSVVLVAAMLLTQSAQQFDLDCRGETQSWSDVYPRTTMDFDTRVHIDLDRMLWCAKECSRVNPIMSATASELVLSDDRNDTGYVNIAIDRITGAYMLRVKTDTNNTVLMGDAQCSVGDYTPIPAARF